MDDKVLLTLLAGGINPKHKATSYLCALIEEGRDRRVFPLKTHGYPFVAAKFGTTVACVDKAIQNAISAAWTRRTDGSLYGAFGDIVDEKKGKPTSAKFLASVIGAVYGEEAAERCGISFGYRI